MPGEEIGYLFSNFGVPTAFAILMYIIYDKSQKWWQEQSVAQEKRHQEQVVIQDNRHHELTNKFIEELNVINANNKLEHDETHECLNNLSSVIDIHIKQKDALIKMSNNNLDLLKQKDNTINELFTMLKEEIRSNRNGK